LVIAEVTLLRDIFPNGSLLGEPPVEIEHPQYKLIILSNSILDGFVKSPIQPIIVIPVKTGIQ
jgi:hypothetical protein